MLLLFLAKGSKASANKPRGSFNKKSRKEGSASQNSRETLQETMKKEDEKMRQSVCLADQETTSRRIRCQKEHGRNLKTATDTQRQSKVSPFEQQHIGLVFLYCFRLLLQTRDLCNRPEEEARFLRENDQSSPILMHLKLDSLSKETSDTGQRLRITDWGHHHHLLLHSMSSIYSASENSTFFSMSTPNYDAGCSTTTCIRNIKSNGVVTTLLFLRTLVSFDAPSLPRQVSFFLSFLHHLERLKKMKNRLVLSQESWKGPKKSHQLAKSCVSWPDACSFCPKMNKMTMHESCLQTSQDFFLSPNRCHSLKYVTHNQNHRQWSTDKSLWSAKNRDCKSPTVKFKSQTLSKKKTSNSR